MKMTKRLLAAGLVAVMTLGLTACGGGGKDKIGDSATDIEIKYWNSGLGTAWLEATIEAFEKKYPEYNVEYSATADVTTVDTAYGLEDADTVDLYFCERNYDTSDMVVLNDLMQETAEGDTKPLIEKFNPAYLKMEADADGKYHGLTYGGGYISVVYNKKMFEEAGIKQLPRTSDELKAVCDKLSRAGVTPFAHFQGGGYWRFISEAWFAQADGLDYYLNTFYANKGEDGTSPSKDALLKKDGRYDVLKAYEGIITPEFTMEGSNTDDHIKAQTKFLDGRAAMMINGTWLANEMESTGNVDNLAMMRLPVISSIKKRLTTVKSDSVLRVLVSAIDSVLDGEKTADDYKAGDDYEVDGNQIAAADWDIVMEARKTVSAQYSGGNVFIPTYSNAKEGAEKFIKFMFSDEGYKIYTDTLHMTMPITLCEGEVDTKDWNEFELEQYELVKTADNFVCDYIASKHKIFIDGGAALFANEKFYPKMCSKNAADRMSADDVWAAVTKKINDEYENSYLANIK